VFPDLLLCTTPAMREDDMNRNRYHWLFLRFLAPVLLLDLVLTAGLPSLHALAEENGNSAPVKACFEGPALKAIGSQIPNDEMAQNIAAIAAGKLCDEKVSAVITECLTKAETSDSEDQGTYQCIGIAANTCIESAWAATEFRKVVCADAEERFWLQMNQANLAKLRSALDVEGKERLQHMEDAFVKYRDYKCGIYRSVFERNGPLLAYGACATESAGRLGIDLRELVAEAENGKGKP
jgi:hypothetical protein